MIRYLICLLVVSGLCFAQKNSNFDGKIIWKHINYLASKKFKGRQGGTINEEKAALYLKKELDKAKIATIPGQKRFQNFMFRQHKKTYQSRNVLAYIPGSNPKLKHQIIILGAHFDHVGVRNKKIYFGADDNASGTAVVLEIAKRLSKNRKFLGRSILIVFFGSEELGLIGSHYFVKAPPIKLKNIFTMVNIDMIGRPFLDFKRFKWLKKWLNMEPK